VAGLQTNGVAESKERHDQHWRFEKWGFMPFFETCQAYTVQKVA
jgi:hypothetical protein